MCSVLAQSIKSFYFCVLGHPEDKEPAGVLAAEIKRFNMVRALSGIRHGFILSGVIPGTDSATAADLLYII